jgi:hypothetical protein
MGGSRLSTGRFRAEALKIFIVKKRARVTASKVSKKSFINNTLQIMGVGEMTCLAWVK